MDVRVSVGEIAAGDLLSGKRLLITGGSSGIGYEIARNACKQGAKVVITGRNKIKLERARDAICREASTKDLNIVCWDVTDFKIMGDKLEECFAFLGGILDCFVCNAGIYIHNIGYGNTTEEDWDSLLTTDLKAPFFITNYVVRKLLENNREGCILLIASECGLCAYTNPYALAKAGLIRYGQGLTYELREKGIRCNVLCPGGTVSDINHIDKAGNLYREDIHGRWVLPEEIAQTAVFLMSDAARSINGEIIALNGGNVLPVEWHR